MILPTKHLPSDRALLTVGARVLALLDEPRTVSSLWDRIRLKRELRDNRAPMSYDWFVLALDLLYLMGAINFHDGVVQRSTK
ncbi:ABC-three component system middle component 6 [Bradyrhizobium sp. USDA 4516]